MGLISDIERKNLAINDPKAWDSSLWNLRGMQTPSGEHVDEYTALTYSAFYNAVNLISSTIAGLPLHLMRNDGDKKKKADSEELYYVMHDDPNPFMTSLIFREVQTAHILTWGNSYAEKVRNKMGEIIQLWPIPPNRIKYIEMTKDLNLWYGIDVESEVKWVPRDSILHIPGLGFDGFIGYSVVAMARKSLGLGMAMETFGSNYFGKGTHPGVIVSTPNKLDAVSHANLRQSLTDTYSGLGQAHRLMLLEEGLKIESISVSPEDSQFLESRQFQIPEVARWFNLPPHKLKDLTKSSFNNIEAEQISFLVDSIYPWVKRFEENYNSQLLTKIDRRVKKRYFIHNMEGLLRANSQDRAKFYESMIKNTIMTPNEVREKENINPSDDPLANQLFVSTQMIPMSKLDQYLAKNSSISSPQSEESEGSSDSEDDSDIAPENTRRPR